MSVREGSVAPRRFDAQLLAWLAWIPFVPLMVLAGDRLRPDRLSWAAVIGGHAAVGLAVALVQPAVAVTAIYTVVPRDLPVGGYYRNVLNQVFVIDFITYLGCVVAYLVRHYLQRAHADELATARARVTATRLDGLMTDARLAALRRELRPHFLHNALQSVSGLIREGRPDRAVRMLEELDDLFRRSLTDADGAPVPLAEELHILDSYASIEMVRFEDRMRIVYDVPEELREIRVPPLLLQPLVENAVRHGVARTTRRVTIRVVVRAQSGRCRIVVENDGPPPRTTAGNRGVGLSNTEDRLRLLYGEAAHVSLRPGEHGGAVATVEFPLEPAPARSAP